MSRHKSLIVLVSLMMLVAFPACQNSVDSASSFDDVYLHIRASWSPDGKTIAFTSNIQNATGIYLMDSVGGNVRQIYSGDGVGLTWAPDGKWLAFCQGGTLYKIKPMGDSLTIVTDVSGAIRPAWSPDGAKIAFVQRTPGLGVWIYDFNKNVASQILSYGDFPSWNPLTGELVVLSAQFDQTTGYILYTYSAVDIASTAVRSLGSFATGADCGFSPISPKGNTIVLAVKRPDDYAQVWVYNLTENTITRLTDDGGDYPSWNPDGTKIVYTRTQAGDGGLWVMNADGSNKRRLTKP
jgi:Tol biopolymer transport system component